MFHRRNFTHILFYFVQALKLTQFSPFFSFLSVVVYLFVRLLAIFVPFFSWILLARALSVVSIWAMDIIYCKHWASDWIYKETTTTWRINVKMYETKLMEKRDKNTAFFSFVFPLFPFTFPCHHAPFRVFIPHISLGCFCAFQPILMHWWTQHTDSDTRKYGLRGAQMKNERQKKRETTTYLMAN